MVNELHQETSPYLLQHANNPIHWRAWSESTLALAKSQNKLLLVSIGYAACHWCHVMEHESFESNEVAAIQNQYFINIKVDKEERPDVDAIYMKAVQIMTGRGGWPLNVVCLPDGRPIWGGTYFRKDDWLSVLQQLHQLYVNEPEKVEGYAMQLAEGLQSMHPVVALEEQFLVPWQEIIEKWQKSFDLEYGGHARAPKFMMPTNLEFFWQFSEKKDAPAIKEQLHRTLTRMAWGGLFDVVEGGFARYSVDIRWHVPHFEKMLYDNGQLLSVYAKAFQQNPEFLYQEVVVKIVDFLQNQLRSPEGLFYASLDADSINENGTLQEGAFYVWKKQELQNLLKNDFEKFAELYNINQFGYWEHGNYVLIQNQSYLEFSQKFNLTFKEVINLKNQWLQILKESRDLRPKPRLDDKIITSWNALTIIGLLDAYQVFLQTTYWQLAEQAIQFLIQNLYQNHQLYRIYHHGKPKIEAFLEDYAYMIQALLYYFKCKPELSTLILSKELTDLVLDRFYDAERGFFAFHPQQKSTWNAHYEIEDNVIPSANAIMAKNLRILGLLYANTYYESVSKKMTLQVMQQVDYPSAYSHWLQEALHWDQPSKEILIFGPEAASYFKKFTQTYSLKNLVYYTEKSLPVPFFQRPYTEQTLFYVCEHGACLQPIKTWEELEDLMIGSS
jgi:uncharacterized protein YyaL (SSP411 family)